MTKALLSVFILTLTFQAYACRPAPLVECSKKNTTVDPERFKDLLTLVEGYQTLLTKKITPPERRSSCFNNNFANYYSKAFYKKIVSTNGKTCDKQISQVKTAINNLIDKNSEENLSVLKKHDKKHLKKEAKKVRIALMVLP